MDRGDPGSKPNSNASESLRPDPISNRRVGSGRLRPSQAQPEDFDRDRDRDRDRERDRDRDRRFDNDTRYGFRGERSGRDWGAPPGRNDLRGGRGGKMDPRGNGPGNRRARDNVPEWMDAPVNQDDLMELRGFDDSPEKEAKSKQENILKCFWSH